MTEMQESTFKPGDLVRWIGEWSFPLVDAPPRENTVLAIEADGKVRLEGRHGNEAPQRWCCPPSQLVHREPCAQQIASEDASSPAGELLPECSACGETCHWNDEADRDDSDSILCNPCAQRIASETSQYLRDFEASLVSAGKWDAQPELPLNLLAREIVAQAERWRIDAEHYRSEASNATATMVESLSAEVAQLTGEVAATRAEANRQIETLRETANRKLGEMREHNKANIMERDKARSENAALREEVQMWRDRAEHRLVMAWRGKVQRMADHLGADDSSSLPNYGEFGPNNTSEKLPRVIDTVTLSTIGALCRHFILITTADKQCPEGRAGRRLSVGPCRIVVEPTVNGPVINDVPDPNVAWSAYAYVHDVRVDLYGCGPTPTAALECLERDRQRKMERLKETT